MNTTETKKNTFRCTEEEWKQISDYAKEAGMSANQYLLDKALSAQDQSLILSLQKDIKTLKEEMENLLLPLAESSRSEDRINRILKEVKLLRPGFKFLALAVKDRLLKSNREDDYMKMVEEATKGVDDDEGEEKEDEKED